MKTALLLWTGIALTLIGWTTAAGCLLVTKSTLKDQATHAEEAAPWIRTQIPDESLRNRTADIIEAIGHYDRRLEEDLMHIAWPLGLIALANVTILVGLYRKAKSSSA